MPIRAASPPAGQHRQPYVPRHRWQLVEPRENRVFVEEQQLAGRRPGFVRDPAAAREIHPQHPLPAVVRFLVVRPQMGDRPAQIGSVRPAGPQVPAQPVEEHVQEPKKTGHTGAPPQP